MFVFILGVTFFHAPAHAWGPHTQITAAALEVQPNKEEMQRYFKDDWRRISRDYCWMGDWQEAVRPDHYPDDYLLFPSMPMHVSHMLPAVRQTYSPFFRRVLQARRTESPREAARWLGSLLHFVQDSGSPPHTTGIGGVLHAKMEQWVDESSIDVRDYHPQLFGGDDESALRGFEARMERLIEFSRVRAIKLKPILEPLSERKNQRLELESALETARMTADLVHTVWQLGSQIPKRRADLAGEFKLRTIEGYAQLPAKVMLAGTDYSTTTEPDGTFSLTNIPPGRYKVLVLATGHECPPPQPVELKDGKSARLQLSLDPDAGNRIRNARFQTRWIDPRQPDWWRRDAGGRWCSALVRVPVEQVCVLRFEWHAGKAAPVSVRWRANPASVAGSAIAAVEWKEKDATHSIAEFVPDAALKPFDKGFLYAEVMLQAKEDLSEICRHISLRIQR